MIDLDPIVKEFSTSLFGLYKLASEEIDGSGIKRPSWLQSYLVFCALERCRGLVGGPADHTYCRFSLGKRAPGKPSELEAVLHKCRSLNAAVTLRPAHLKEHFVDFSISVGTVEQGWGNSDLPLGVKFQLLLAAESEMNEGFGKDVLEDGLKLLDTIALVKVLVFPSHPGGDARKEHERRLVTLFNAHGPEGHQDKSKWLLFGIPKFDEWEKEEGDPSKLAREVYTLAPRTSGNDYSFKDISQLWTNHVPAL